MMIQRLVVVLFCLFSLFVKAEEEQSPGMAITITGIVLDEQGNPLPGASVWVKGEYDWSRYEC